MALAGVSGSATAAARAYFGAGERMFAVGYAGAALLVLVATVARAYFAVREHRRRVSTHDLAGCVHTLVAILLAGEPASKSGLRATIMIPAQKDSLEQAVEYAGDNRTNARAGRLVPVNCGIAGLVFRTKKPKVAFMEDGASHDAFVEEMVRSWGFSDAAARALDPEPRSWAAYPIESADKQIVGVLYLDSKQKDFFTEDRQIAIGSSVAGIAFFVGLRYAKQ